jgi:hypothetical protein
MSAGQLNLVPGDTDVCPWDVGVHASRSTFIAGNSALGAALQVKDQILNAAADILDAPRDSLDLRAGWSSAPPIRRRPPSWTRCSARPHFALSGNTMFMTAYFYEPPTDLMAGDFKGNYSMALRLGLPRRGARGRHQDGPNRDPQVRGGARRGPGHQPATPEGPDLRRGSAGCRLCHGGGAHLRGRQAPQPQLPRL